MQSFDDTKGDIAGSALGKALSMSATTAWADIVAKIKGVVNRGSNDKTFTPTTNKQTQSYSAGYYTGGTVTVNAVALSGNAATGDVLTGKTFYNSSLTKQTGTMPDRSNTIQTATTSTSDQSKSCYRINGSNVEVVPAKGYWGNWDWTKSCIRLPLKAAIATNQLSWSINGFGRASENNNENINLIYTATETCYALAVLLVNVNNDDKNSSISITTTGTIVYQSNNPMAYGCRLVVALLTNGKNIKISGTYNTIWGGQGNMATIIVAK